MTTPVSEAAAKAAWVEYAITDGGYRTRDDAEGVWGALPEFTQEFWTQVAGAVRAELVEPVLALHPKVENPTHGCCAPPKLCKGHKAECRGREHSLNFPTWPCATLRALGVES